MPAADDDWRLSWGHDHLLGAVFRLVEFRTRDPMWDHEHCEFCWGKITDQPIPDTLRSGYTTEDSRHWVCPTCFEDFRERFQFRLRPD
jgi:hypothetical protein